MSGEVLGGGQTADDEGQWQTADGEKFLLLFSNAVKIFPPMLIAKSILAVGKNM